jgi:hypothetical protein
MRFGQLGRFQTVISVLPTEALGEGSLMDARSTTNPTEIEAMALTEALFLRHYASTSH